MGAAAVDEAVRNAVAVGADPERCAILDNFSWGDCRLPDRLGALALCAEGAAAAAIALGTPFISGKDSLNNEYQTPSGRLAIPGTLLVSSLAIVPDVARVATMDLKRAGSILYLAGETRDEMGGSHLHLVRGLAGGVAPRVDGARHAALYRAVHGAIRDGLVLSCHDLSEGGIAVAAAEMAIAGEVGVELSLDGGALAPAVGLFSESAGRLLIETSPEGARELESRFVGHALVRVGETRPAERINIRVGSGDVCIDLPIKVIREAWRCSIREFAGVTPESPA
jgi:phosphoribosylformylglycinamidine synthase